MTAVIKTVIIQTIYDRGKFGKKLQNFNSDVIIPTYDWNGIFISSNGLGKNRWA